MCWSNNCCFASSLALQHDYRKMRSHAVKDISVCLCALAVLDSAAVVVQRLIELGLVESVGWKMDGLGLATDLARVVC